MLKYRLIFILFFSLFSTVAWAQNDGMESNEFMRELYIERAKSNLELLAKHESIRDYVVIDDKGITILSSPKGAPEFKLFWYEATQFLKMCHGRSYHDMIQFYNSKGTKPLSLPLEKRMNDFWRFQPDDIKQLSIALDPGHFAKDWKSALQEDKYIKVKASDVGTEKDIEFYEAELTMATCQLVMDSLKKLQVQDVFLSHNNNESIVGKDFDQWFEEDFVKDTKMLMSTGELSQGLGNKLLSTKNKYRAFKYVYEYLDMVGRSRKINSQGPDVTLIVHYNADENGQRLENNYWPVTDKNYSMTFVPGAFMYGELSKKDARVEFLRLLITPDLEESIRLSKFFLKEMEESLNVKPLTQEQESEMLKKSCIATDVPGTYSRNLYMTRAIESPLLYIEALFQDNVDEVKVLGEKDLTVNGIKTNYRVLEVRDAIIASLLEWLKENKAKKEAWSAQNMSDGSY